MSSLYIHIYNASYVNTDTFFESFSIQSKTKEFSLICAILRFKFILRSFPKRRRSRPFHENKIEIQQLMSEIVSAVRKSMILLYFIKVYERENKLITLISIILNSENFQTRPTNYKRRIGNFEAAATASGNTPLAPVSTRQLLPLTQDSTKVCIRLYHISR